MQHAIRHKVLPMFVALAFVATACGSDDAATAPAATTDAATDATDAPAEATDAPAEATDAPAEATDAPAEATDPPTDATDAPTNESMCVVTGEAATGDPIKVGSIQGTTGPDDFSSSGQGAKAFFDPAPVRFGLGGNALEHFDLAAQMFKNRRHRPGVATLALARGKTEPGNRRQPFFQLAVESALAVASEEFQQTHDQRPGQSEQR